jgi:subtilisin family serine protease
MAKYHDSLLRYKWYSSWHRHPLHKPTHWAVFVITGIIFTSLVTGLGTNALNPLAYAASQYSINTKGEVIKSYESTNSFLVKIKSSSKSQIKSSARPSDTGIASLNAINNRFKVRDFAQISKPNANSKADASVFRWYKVTLPAKELRKDLVISGEVKEATTKIDFEKDTLREIKQQYLHNPNVEIVEPEFVVSMNLVPNDTYYSSSGAWGQSFGDLYGLTKINAAGAWDMTTGNSSIIVADIDTGVDRNHPDLAANMWVNSKEIPNNSIDDDVNGYIDDYYGWDFANNDNDPSDDVGHGTHTVGTIAAVGNNGSGVVGVNWQSKIMTLKFLDSGGSGYLSNAVKSIQYAADMGARVSSNSWGGGGQSQAIEDVIRYAHDKGMVVVVAAGNENNDALNTNPASSDDAITVAATDSNDQKASFSNYGEKIDVAAPGVDILSAKASGGWMCGNTVGSYYCYVSGTSMATPHVAGLAALILSKNPTLTPEEVRQIIRKGVNDLGAAGKDSSFGYGRINAFNSLNISSSRILAPYISTPRSRTLINGNVDVLGSIPGPNFSSYKVEVAAGRTPTSWTTITTSTSQPTTNITLATIDTSRLLEGTNIIRITATDTTGKIYQFQVNDITVDNFEASLSPTSLASISTNNQIMGTALTKGIAFSSYSVEVSPDNSTWSTSGITLTNGGIQSVVNGQLGTWDTSNLSDGNTRYLRLTVRATNGTTYRITNQIRIDKNLVPNWPKTIPYTSMLKMAPIFADVDNDGSKELLYTSYEGKLFAYRKDGTNISGFPVNVGIPGQAINPDYLAAADLDGDGKIEIIGKSVRSDSSGTSVAGSFIVKSDGSFYPGWDRTKPFSGIVSIADLNNDGKKEIIIPEIFNSVENKFYLTFHAYEANGSEISGFPVQYVGNGYIGLNGITIADLDNDGRVEMAFVDGSYTFYLFDNTGRILPNWPQIVYPDSTGTYLQFDGPLAVGDINGDGQKEIFAANNAVCSGLCHFGPGNTGLAFAFKKDGTLLSGWPKGGFSPDLGGVVSPSAGDLDGDGKDELIVPGYPLSIFTDAGRKSISTPNLSTQPSLIDVDGDGKLEIFAGKNQANNPVRGLRLDGSTFWSSPLGTGNTLYGPVIVTDMDKDGQIEAAAIDRMYGITSSGIIGSMHQVYLWQIPGSNPSLKSDWPMIGYNFMRSANNKLSSSLPPIVEPPTVGIGHISLSPTSLNFTSDLNIKPSNQNLLVSNSGTATLNWTASTNLNWCHISPTSGSTSTTTKSTLTVSVDALGTVGTQTCSLSINSANADNSPQGINVNYTISGPIASPQPPTETAPLSPTGFQASASTCGNNWLNLSWNASTGATSYKVTRNGIQVYNGSGTSFSDTGLTLGGTYTYTLLASNSVGTSPSVTISGTVANACPPSGSDTIPPLVNITNPKNGAQVKKNANLSIKADATDNISVSKVEFMINNTLICTDSLSPYTCGFKPTGNSGASFTLQAKAYDSSGNASSSASITITLK